MGITTGRKTIHPRTPSPIEVKLAQYQATDPATLNAEQRAFRELAIRALTIELQLKALGIVGGGKRRPAPADTPSPRAAARRTRRGPAGPRGPTSR